MSKRQSPISQQVLFQGVVWSIMGLGTGLLLGTTPATPGPTTANGIASTKPATQPATNPKGKSEEDITLGFLKQYEPEVYHDAMILREKEPAKYKNLLKELIPDTKKLLEQLRRNQPMGQLVIDDRRLTYRTMQLARKLREGKISDEDKSNYTQELNELVTQQFLVRQKKRQMELADLQRRLDDLKRDLEKRENEKVNLISQRLSDMLKNNPRVEW